jgi:trigger factor
MDWRKVVKSTLEEAGPWRKALTITIEPAEVEKEMDHVLADYRKRAVIPGFRKGKVPDELVKAHFGGSLENDLLQHILPEAIDKAIAEHGLTPAAPARVQDLHFRPGEPLTFVAHVDIWPQVEVTGFEGAELGETVTEIDEQTVDEFLHALQERQAEFIPVARPSAPGDIVETTIIAVDLNGSRLPRAKRQTVRMEADGGNLLPEFRAVSVGLQVGEERMVHITYPEDFGDQELAGKQRHYRMHVKQVMEKKLPSLDDQFAGRIDGLESLEALRSRIRLRLEAEERLRARQRTEEALVDLLIARNEFEVPEGIVERSLVRALEKGRQENPDLDEEEFRQAYTPMVVRLRKREILLDSIARQASIGVSEEELDSEIGHSAPAGVDPRQIRRRLEKDGELDRVRGDLVERKTFDFLLEKAVVNRVHAPRQRQSNIIVP